MQNHHWQTFPIYITLTQIHTLAHAHTLHSQYRVITDKNFPFTRGWRKITILRTSLHPFNLTPSCANAHPTHSQTPWINLFTAPAELKHPFHLLCIISLVYLISVSSLHFIPHFCSAPLPPFSSPHFSTVFTLNSSNHSLYSPSSCHI